MARKAQEIHAELALPPELPDGIVSDIAQAKVSEQWVRATAILLRGRERREARLELEASKTAALASCEPLVNQSPKPKMGEMPDSPILNSEFASRLYVPMGHRRG